MQEKSDAASVNHCCAGSYGMIRSAEFVKMAAAGTRFRVRGSPFTGRRWGISHPHEQAAVLFTFDAELGRHYTVGVFV